MARSLIRLLLLPLLLTAATAEAGETGIVPTPPKNPGKDTRFLFYIQGKILEDKGRRPTHPQYGVYEYDQILGMFAGEGFLVISEIRKPGTRVDGYGKKVAGQVMALLKAGVPAENISVVGFSEGGMMTLAASHYTKDVRIKFAVLAGCFGQNQKYRPVGRFLSILDSGDTAAKSCDYIMAFPTVQGFEVQLSTGKGHGAFYKPVSAWQRPRLRLLKKK